MRSALARRCCCTAMSCSRPKARVFPCRSALRGARPPAAAPRQAVCLGPPMLLPCDVVLAAEGPRFSLPFVDLGLVPEAASSLLLPRIAGRRRAARYLLLGESFGPDEAMHWALVSKAVSAGMREGALAATVAALLAKPATAMRLTQKLLRHDL